MIILDNNISSCQIISNHYIAKIIEISSDSISLHNPYLRKLTIRKIRIVNMSVLFEYNFSFPFIPHYLSKCHYPPLPLQNHFLFSPRRPSAQNPQAEPLSKIQKETQSHTRHTKSKQKSNPKTTIHENPKKNPSKRQSKTVHQTPPTRKRTHPDSHPNPPRIRTNPSRNPYTPKRKDVFPQTQVHFTPNAEEFAPKRFGVSSKTQGRLPTNASPFSTLKSPDNSPSYLPKHPKIP